MLQQALSFFQAFEAWIYLLLGLLALYFIRKFVVAWRELRVASFILERDNAQVRLNQSAVILVILLVLAVAEFVMVSFVAPSVQSGVILPTPTISLLATATFTTSPNTTQTVSAIPTAVLAAIPTISSGCIPGQIEILAPINGQEVSGVVAVLGTADIQNFGFYKIEMKTPDSTDWLTLQAGNLAVQQGKLGDWDTRRLTFGEYQLGLVVVDNQARLSPPCVVTVRVSQAPQVTTVP